jgi:hypothetical protein
MKRYSLVFAILALAALAVAADALRTQIAAKSKVIHAAVMNKDIDAYAKAIRAGGTKDFKCIAYGKAVSSDLIIIEMRDIFENMAKMTSEEAILLSLVVKGSTATGTTEHKIKGTTEPDESGVFHKVAFYGTSVETYRKVNGKWLLSKQVWRTRQMTKSGKPTE